MTTNVGWWLERRLRRATSRDLLALATLALLAVLTVMAGRNAHLSLRPRSAAELGEYLDELELPTRLPNAALVDAAGNHTTLFERIHGPRAVLAFYAPWCGPCQKELPHLADKVGKRAQLLVVVSADEDLEHTRRALANLDLSDLGFVVDISGELQKQGRIRWRCRQPC